MLKKIIFSSLSLLLLFSIEGSRGQSRGQFNERARLVVQIGHTASVSSVAFSPDGKILASGGSWGKDIKLWDVASGQELRTLLGHTSDVNSIAFSPDGKTLASGSSDKTIKLWDVASGRTLRTLVHSGGANPSAKTVAFSPDGKTFASGGGDRTIRLWDVGSGKELHALATVTEGSSIMFSPDGNTLVGASRQYTVIKLWDVASGATLRTLVHSGGVNTVAFSPDGRTLAGGGGDGIIRLWDMTSGKELRAMVAEYAVWSLAYSPDNKTLASVCTFCESITLWDAASGKEVRRLAGHSLEIRSLAYSPDGKTVASGSETNSFGGPSRTIKLWNLTNGKELRTLAEVNSAWSVAFSPDGKILAKAGMELRGPNPAELWDVATGEELLPRSSRSCCTHSVTFSPDGKTVASGESQTIQLLDLTSGTERHPLEGHSARVGSVAFSPDGKTLASGSQDKTIRLWDFHSGRELRTLTENAEVSSVAFSPDGRTLASGGGGIKLWDVTNGSEVRSLIGSSTYVHSVAFSPDGKTLASGSSDNNVTLWDVTSGREWRTLTGHSGAVTEVAFSPDGRTLASGSKDARIKLWDVQSGKELATLIALDEDDWAVVTPEGLFDASPGARKLMHYVVGMEVVTLDQMKDLYYVPGLLQKVMNGEALPKVQLFSAQDLFPEAQYQQPKPGQKTFTVKLRNRGGGIGPAQVLVNGTEAIADARPTGFNSQAKEVTLTIDLSNVKQIVPGKGNKVEVIARNAAGSLNSRGSARGTELVVVDDGKALTAEPELYAIIGGVADYVDPSLRLAYSAKDSADFARALEIGAMKFLGRDKVHIRLLTTAGAKMGGSSEPLGASGSTALSGSDSRVLDATKENFRKVFAEFAAKATTNDILVVYLSGHALALKLNQNPSNLGGDTYLYLTREAYTSDPGKLADEHVRTAMTLSGDELLESIKHIAALKKALVLDTCAAGAAAESLIAHRGDATDTIKIRALENLKGTTGFFILMGSAGDKVSYEATPYRQGLLTYSLLEALKGAKLREGGFADVGQVFGYAQNRVPEIARALGLSQQPRFLAPDVGSPFDVGQYTIDEQKLFSLPNPNPLILRPSLQNKDLGYDNLKLLPVLTRALLEASYATGRSGEQASLVFVDASEMLDAFTPSGLYTVTGNQVTIKLNLIRNEQPAATLTVAGTVTDEPSKAALVQRLVAAISAETRKLIH